MSPSTSSQELEICGFLFDPTRTLTPQCSFLAARLVGMFLKIWKMPSNPPHSPPNLLPVCPILAYLDAPTYFKLLSRIVLTYHLFHATANLYHLFENNKIPSYHYTIISKIKYEYNLHSKKLKLSASECFKFV